MTLVLYCKNISLCSPIKLRQLNLSCLKELNTIWHKALFPCVNLVNSIANKFVALSICFMYRKYFFFANIGYISLTIFQIYWSGIGQLTRNVIWKVFSFLLKRQSAIWLLAATQLADSADLWCFFYCSGPNYYTEILFLVYVQTIDEIFPFLLWIVS